MGYLPNRRDGNIIVFSWPSGAPVYDVHVHYSRHDEDVAEAFVDLYKHGSVKSFDNDVAEAMKDWARQLSLELQDGTPIAAVATRIRRGDQGEALSLIGAVTDALCAEQYG